ncbi:MAG: purine-nucleoside phosphorylase [Opitutaceae bacterium]|nr:purine-nucleoside phosphorylase [Opitutaceae bacterium]
MSKASDTETDLALAREALEYHFGGAPKIGLILGSGLSELVDFFEEAKEASYRELPGFMPSTVEGHKGALVRGKLEGVPVVAMAGRNHLYEGHSAAAVVFPLRALIHWGIDSVVITNAAGGISSNLAEGDLMLISDHLNLTGRNPLVGENVDSLGPRFPDMSYAYDPELREKAKEIGTNGGFDLKEGVYASNLGPSYETPAEVEMLDRMGADAVGMSTVLEVIAARHAGARVLGLSCITNLAAGKSKNVLSHDDVKEVANRVKGRMQHLVREFVKAI